MQKIDAATCLFTDKSRGERGGEGGRGEAPGSHPVWTCHVQGREKTAPLMEAERERERVPGDVFLSRPRRRKHDTEEEEEEEGKKMKGVIGERGVTGR